MNYENLDRIIISIEREIQDKQVVDVKHVETLLCVLKQFRDNKAGEAIIEFDRQIVLDLN
jgi:hypothetical protein